MFPELGDLLQPELPQGQLINIVEQSPAEAGFVLCHLIGSALSAGATVRVLALDKPPSHYRHVCAKCGCNVRQAESSGKLTFIDGAVMSLAALRSDSGPLAPSAAGLSLKALFEELTNLPGPSAERSLLVVDGLAVLTALGASVSETLLLVSNLAAWSRAHGGTAATLTSRDAEDEELARLSAALRGPADMTVTVRALTSGYCPEVTGELEVRRRGGTALHRQFKAEYRNVRVFAPGTSRAVL